MGMPTFRNGTGRDGTIPEIVAVLFYGTGRIIDTPWDLLMELHAMESAITVAYVPTSYLVVILYKPCIRVTPTVAIYIVT